MNIVCHPAVFANEVGPSLCVPPLSYVLQTRIHYYTSLQVKKVRGNADK